MREKTLAKVGLHNSSAKIWKMQRDANNKIKVKAYKPSDEFEKSNQEYLIRLETSHEITLKYAKYLEQTLYSTHKIYSKAHFLLDPAPLSPLKFQSKLEELEMIRYKDLNRLKEMELIELRVLDQLSQKQVHIEADLLVLIERLKDKMIYYEHSVRTLEQQIDNISLKYKSQETQLEAQLQEITLRASMQASDLEKYHESVSNHSEVIEKLREENKLYSLQNSHLKSAVEELTRSEKQSTEKYTNEIARLYNEINSLRHSISTDEAQEIKERHEAAVVSSRKHKEIINTIREITHNVFIKYGKSQSEWNEPHWKEELETYKGEYGDLLVEIEFICYLIVKLTSDNNWLVDRLADLGKENHKLREDGRSPTPSRLKEDVINDLRTASNALKEFEEARDKLMSQFSY